jgi:hypothetical protein
LLLRTHPPAPSLGKSGVHISGSHKSLFPKEGEYILPVERDYDLN